MIGAPGAIRTPDPLVRSQVLYPTELRARCIKRRQDYTRGVCGVQLFLRVLFPGLFRVLDFKRFLR